MSRTGYCLTAAPLGSGPTSQAPKQLLQFSLGLANPLLQIHSPPQLMPAGIETGSPLEALGATRPYAGCAKPRNEMSTPVATLPVSAHTAIRTQQRDAQRPMRSTIGASALRHESRASSRWIQALTAGT